ncbi:MAG TPA: hypothetical protein VFJ82_24235 [Longimicrobium sp.]|nr:hypothetical protein [Longimicrobium sp.]
MSNTDDFVVTRLRPRPSEEVTLSIPLKALTALREVAAERDMSIEALMRFYIGQGLREDVSRRFSERLMEKTEQVLARHIASEDERFAILAEIRDDQAA